MHKEFQEIAHCGGKVTFTLKTTEDGKRTYQVRIEHRRPGPAAFRMVYALPQGIPIDTIRTVGIGEPENIPPTSDSYEVYIGSDSEGLFGSQCPSCKEYWRYRGGFKVICPYCGSWGLQHHFLTDAQKQYVQQYCALLNKAFRTNEDGTYIIDMDVVADAVVSEEEKPAFYYAEESQQNKFICRACGEFADIKGEFGYCPTCGTRNDFQQLQKKVGLLHKHLIQTESYEDGVQKAVSYFDALVRQYLDQFSNRIPMTPRRQKWIKEKKGFHALIDVVEKIKTIFDIDIFKGISKDDIEFARVRFLRRHVYEHNGGEADKKYIEESGEENVRLKQKLHETKDSSHCLVSIIVKMAKNLHQGFHEIFPPEQGAIQLFSRKK